MKSFLITALLFAGSCQAQTIQVAAGASTLYNAEGGSITLYSKDTTTNLGAGVSNGHLVAGASTETILHGWDTTFGDKGLFLSTMQLGLSTTLRGVQANRKGVDWTLTVFGGAVGQAYSTPFFSGTVARDFGTGFQFTKKYQHWDLSTVEAWTSGKPTTLQGVVFHAKGLTLQGTAGLLERRTYFIGQATQRWQHASIDAGRQTFIWLGQRSTVTSGSLSAWYGPLDAHANISRSSLAMGKNAGVGLRLGPVTVHGDAFLSHGQRTLSGSTYERVTRHWSLSQFITRSNGSTSFNFGGSYTSNLVTATVGWQQAFIPFGKVPFQKVLSVTLSFQLPHGTSFNASTVAAPAGGVRWTTYGGTYVQAPWATLPMEQQAAGSRLRIKGFELRGHVVDNFGVAVAGAAIVINGETTYSDLQGEFISRVKRNATVELIIDLEGFTAPGVWEVVSAPANATPGSEILITVRRK